MHSMSGHGYGHSPGHGHGGGEQASGCCCHSGHGFRRFPTREEQIAHMEEYLNNLKAEAKGVEEHLAELKKA
ncbi:hypothetical protein ACFLYQ_02640 [Chloroflexota bacterium]